MSNIFEKSNKDKQTEEFNCSFEYNNDMEYLDSVSRRLYEAFSQYYSEDSFKNGIRVINVKLRNEKEKANHEITFYLDEKDDETIVKCVIKSKYDDRFWKIKKTINNGLKKSTVMRGTDMERTEYRRKIIDSGSVIRYRAAEYIVKRDRRQESIRKKIESIKSKLGINKNIPAIPESCDSGSSRAKKWRQENKFDSSSVQQNPQLDKFTGKNRSTAKSTETVEGPTGPDLA